MTVNYAAPLTQEKQKAIDFWLFSSSAPASLFGVGGGISLHFFRGRSMVHGPGMGVRGRDAFPSGPHAPQTPRVGELTTGRLRSPIRSFLETL